MAGDGLSSPYPLGPGEVSTQMRNLADLAFSRSREEGYAPACTPGGLAFPATAEEGSGLVRTLGGDQGQASLGEVSGGYRTGTPGGDLRGAEDHADLGLRSQDGNAGVGQQPTTVGQPPTVERDGPSLSDETVSPTVCPSVVTVSDTTVARNGPDRAGHKLLPVRR